MFCNVLDNAAKHGGAGKRIDASMTREGSAQVIRVRDYGPGIPEAELPYVKQKFYKDPPRPAAAASALLCATRSCGSTAAPSRLPMPRAAARW